MKNNATLKVFGAIALGVILMGAGGSVILTYRAGRNNDSILLQLLFMGWVSSPFIALLIANALARNWSARARVALYWLMILITFGSLLMYYGMFRPTGTKTAFVFLVVPFISWLIIAIIFIISANASRSKK